MRSESDIRDRLAMELMGATTHESPSPTESPPSGNGASE
jgi:hypothetical protein